MMKRALESTIKKDLFKGKAIVVLGPRQVGKTTLIKKLLAEMKLEISEFNGDDPADRRELENKSLKDLESLVGKAKVIFIDEAQKITTIGQTVKLLVDKWGKERQVILTGSSSLGILRKSGEALTGRQFLFQLYPISVKEMEINEGVRGVKAKFEDLLIYGGYPEVYLTESRKEKERLLGLIYETYLFRDVLELAEIRRKQVLVKLLEALALQIGKQVSMRKLAEIVGVDAKTVERYIELLEESYVVFRLRPYFKNKRKSLRRMNKVYFYDVGIRNAILNDFRRLDLRGDVGELWENWLIGERMKLMAYKQIRVNQYFWRGYSGAEVDYVEERNGRLVGVEIKRNKSKGRGARNWLELGGGYKLVNRENFWEWLE